MSLARRVCYVILIAALTVSAFALPALAAAGVVNCGSGGAMKTHDRLFYPANRYHEIDFDNGVLITNNDGLTATVSWGRMNYQHDWVVTSSALEHGYATCN